MNLEVFVHKADVLTEEYKIGPSRASPSLRSASRSNCPLHACLTSNSYMHPCRELQAHPATGALRIGIHQL